MTEIGKNWPTLPRLTDEERAQVMDRMDELVDERSARIAQGEWTLRSICFRAGVRFENDEMTLEAAHRMIRAAMYRMDPECPVMLVPAAEARDIGLQAFDQGVAATHRRKKKRKR